MTDKGARRIPRALGPMVPLVIQIPQEVETAIRSAAAQDDVSMSWWIVAQAARSLDLPQYEDPPAHD